MNGHETKLAKKSTKSQPEHLKIKGNQTKVITKSTKNQPEH